MKYSFTLLSILLVNILSAEMINLPPFHTIVSGPHVELELKNGLDEAMEIETDGVSREDVIYEVKGKTLHIYLRNARNIEKTKKYKNGRSKWSVGIYKDSKIKATITFRDLRKLVTKGKERVNINGPIGGQSFKYKSYGDQKVSFASIETENFRAKLYGETDLKIKNGYADLQRYKLYGDHNIDTQNVKTKKVKASNFGEVDLDVDTKIVALTSFGIADIKSKSRAVVRKGIVIGETRIR